VAGDAESSQSEDVEHDGTAPRRRRRRGGRGRGGRKEGDAVTAGDGRDGAESVSSKSESTRTADQPDQQEQPDQPEQGEASADADDGSGSEGSGSRRRRRRRRRGGGGGDEPSADRGEAAASTDDPPNTVVRVREPRSRGGGDDEVQGIKSSTRLEAKRQRRHDGRDQGRRRTPVISESEFLARRESVERIMAVRQVGERTQIAVLEDGVLVEHYVASAEVSTSAGNVYLGKVQNVLPSMEAAFVDIGRGRNAVLYAGEVNFDAAGLEGQPKRIESALKSGQPVVVQVTKEPIGHKGARLTSQVSLPGRFLVYVPENSMTGISRKLPDTERTRLKSVLKKVLPENAGVIVRTAAEGASEEELSRDVSRLAAQWEDIERKAGTASAPELLHGEPDLTVRVIRDVFNEDFASLVVAGDRAWETVQPYLDHVAPDLVSRVSRWTSEEDIFAAHRVDEQLAKALDRKVWLPSGGSLVIDRTEAMVVVDVNTGKFTGKGSNLEETITRNNLEAAEEVVRQLRLRDLGGIIVIDFIDMVLEGNRDLVMRRLMECLGRDRTKHQVAEVTSLGLVQMTRKRVGQGLLEAFSDTCETCNGRGVRITLDPMQPPTEGNGHRSSQVPPARRPFPMRPPTPALVATQAAPPELPDAESPSSLVEVLEPDVEPVVTTTPTRTRRPRRASRDSGPPAVEAVTS
jgi:ribonuclease E